MKTLTLLTDLMNQNTNPLDIIDSREHWEWLNGSMPNDTGGGASPFYYGAPVSTAVLPDNWTESEVAAFASLRRSNTPIVLELEDDIYDKVIARIESRQIRRPSQV